MRTRTVSGIAVTLVVGVLVGAPSGVGAPGATATAQSTTVRGHSVPHQGMRLGKVTVDNTGSAITAVARVRGLVPHRGSYDLVLDVGNRDRLGRPNHAFMLQGDVPRRTDAATGPPTLLHFSSVTEESSAVPCDGASQSFDWAAEKVRLTVPQACLGSDAGMTRAQLELWYPCDCDSPWGFAETGVLQSGPRGARYGDVNGDGRVDTVTETSPRRSRYKVVVDLGRRTISALAPRSRDFAWHGAKPWSVIDVDHDGDAEVIGTPADTAGDGGYHHVFTFVGGELKLARTTDGSPLQLVSAAAGSDYFRDFRCGPAGLQTWQLTGGSGTDSYQVADTTWTLDRGTATATGTATVGGVDRGAAGLGNWSSHSCLTR